MQDPRPIDAGHSARATDRRRLILALVIATGTMALEVAGGLATGSLALLADAGHVLSDAAALSLALFAVWLAGRPHTARETYGFHRAEVIAATMNALVLLGISAVIVWQATSRLREPTEVQAVGLILIALTGLAANGAQVFVLGHAHSVNVRAARLHVLSDLGGSVVAVLAGVVIYATGWRPIDPLLSLVIVALIVVGAVRLLRETLGILMEHAPPEMELQEVSRALLEQDEVLAVHEVHIWTITSGFVALTAHIQVRPGVDAVRTAARSAAMLQERFGIEHATIQPEYAEIHDLEYPGDVPVIRRQAGRRGGPRRRP